jgi:hypothetical protein
MYNVLSPFWAGMRLDGLVRELVATFPFVSLL